MIQAFRALLTAAARQPRMLVGPDKPAKLMHFGDIGRPRLPQVSHSVLFSPIPTCISSIALGSLTDVLNEDGYACLVFQRVRDLIDERLHDSSALHCGWHVAKPPTRSQNEVGWPGRVSTLGPFAGWCTVRMSDSVKRHADEDIVSSSSGTNFGYQSGQIAIKLCSKLDLHDVKARPVEPIKSSRWMCRLRNVARTTLSFN